MAEIRGCDLVVEYLIKEKVPYLFGYAGHGAVGLLDGVYNHQDELKIIFPRIESAAGYMADAYFRASGQVIPVYTSTGPGPMLLTVAMGNAFYDSSAFIAITGQVATNQYDSGALQEEYRHYQADFPSDREGDHEAELPGAERRGSRQVPAQGVQARAHRPARPRAHRRAVRPLDPHRRRRGAGARRSARRCSTGARPARPRRSPGRSRC